MVNEFKAFALKGNVVELAIGVIIGMAFGNIVTALVDGILMPLLAALVQQPKMNWLYIMIGETPIMYGIFLQAVINFLVVAVVLFLVVKAINATRRRQDAEVPAATQPSEEVLLLRDIRNSLRK